MPVFCRWMLNRAIRKYCGQMVTSQCPLLTRNCVRICNISAPDTPPVSCPGANIGSVLHTQATEHTSCSSCLSVTSSSKRLLIKARNMKVTKYEASCRCALGQLGTVTRLQTEQENRGSIPEWAEIFLHSNDTGCGGQVSLLSNGKPGSLSQRVKRLRREARLRVLELHLHASIRLHGVVLNYAQE
jgi:hypothetical protein